jgi:hypothetical protein
MVSRDELDTCIDVSLFLPFEAKGCGSNMTSVAAQTACRVPSFRTPSGLTGPSPVETGRTEQSSVHASAMHKGFVSNERCDPTTVLHSTPAPSTQTAHRTEDRGRRMEDGGWRMKDGGWRMECDRNIVFHSSLGASGDQRGPRAGKIPTAVHAGQMHPCLIGNRHRPFHAFGGTERR